MESGNYVRVAGWGGVAFVYLGPGRRWEAYYGRAIAPCASARCAGGE